MARRHGAELDAAIRAAVLTLLADQGPQAVTMEAVAAEARTSKPVLYRRWPDRRSLLRDTLLGLATTSIPTADTGSYREDMLAVLRGWAALFTGDSAALMRSVVAAVATDTELAAIFRSDVIGMRKIEMDALIARGMRRGEVRTDAPVELLRELGQSVLWHRLLISGDPMTDDVLVTIVDEILLPVASPTTARS